MHEQLNGQQVALCDALLKSLPAAVELYHCICTFIFVEEIIIDNPSLFVTCN